MTRLSVRSAQALIEALFAPEGGVVMATHRTIRAAPQRALALGSHQGRDVIDALIEQARGRGGVAMVAAGTLSMFVDERVCAFFLVMLESADGPTLDAAATWLAATSGPLPIDRVVGALLQNQLARRARVAGRVLRARRERLSGRAALRLALIDPEAALPPLDDESWRDELEGVLAGDARAALESFGRAAFDRFVAEWEALSVDTARWLLEWGVSRWSADCVEVLGRALADERLAGTALSCLERVPSLAPALRGALSGLLGGDRKTRLRAIRLGGEGDWARLIESERDSEVRAACVARWAPSAPLEDLVGLLIDPDWMVRAAASEALTARGEAAVEPLRARVHDPRVEVRAAAMQVLAALGEEMWLEEAVMSS
jgi:hypothetical protein